MYNENNNDTLMKDLNDYYLESQFKDNLVLKIPINNFQMNLKWIYILKYLFYHLDSSE